MTFSIVGWDPDTEEWGAGVASKFLAAGAVVPWAKAGVGVVATQALANVAYGPQGLRMLEAGASAQEAVDALTANDDQRDDRQVGIVDGSGRAATWTGSSCLEWAGGITGDGHACQGNILTGPDVVERMAAAFESTEGDLASRIMAAMTAGDAAGGDRRGRQSASILVVREGGGYGGGTDVTIDLRVDDHARPIAELGRLLDIHRLLFPRPEDLEFVPIDARLESSLTAALESAGYQPDRGLREALYAYVGTENLEERWSEDQSVVERGILRHLGL